MPATFDEMAAGLEERLATISGLRVFDHVPDVFAVPCAFVLPNTVEYWNAFAGGDVEVEWTITVAVNRTSSKASQRALYDYMSHSGTQSVRAAVEADRTLGGRVQTLIVEDATNIRFVTQNDAQYLTVDFGCRIHA